MKNILLLISLTPLFLFSNFKASITPITPNIKSAMLQGNSYRSGCPVPFSSLRYIRLSYIGFDNKEHMGDLIVNKSVTNDVVQIFKELYNVRYPIRKMELVSNYNGDDFASIEADNTSAFNCRVVAGTNRWSKHSFGKAIDINPLENPYVANNGHTAHIKSLRYLRRVHRGNSANQRALILKSDFIVKLFQKYGWRWGGSWRCCKDYQHFDKN